MAAIWTDWLPEALRREAQKEEKRRFDVLVAQLKQTWEAHKADPWPENLNCVLEYYYLLFQ